MIGSYGATLSISRVDFSGVPEALLAEDILGCVPVGTSGERRKWRDVAPQVSTTAETASGRHGIIPAAPICNQTTVLQPKNIAYRPCLDPL